MAIRFDKSKLVRNLSKGNVLAPFLERAFETFDESWTFDYTEKEHDNAWHPSGDCTPDVTTLYDKVLTHGQDREGITGSLRKSFMVGHYWHQLIQFVVLHKLKFCEPAAIERSATKWWGTLEDTLIDPTSSVPHGVIRYENGWGTPEPFHWVSGAGDIAPLITPRWRGLVDIKTMSSHQFKQPTLPTWAVAKYTCQMNLYLDLFDEDRGIILAVNKDAPHDFKEFTFERDQALIDAVYAKWKFVSQCVINNTVPTDKDNKEYELPL